MKFDRTNLARNLPDTYPKDKDSNLYKILQIERDAVDTLDETLSQIAEMLDIDKATGAILDLYGDDIGQKRGNANDDQYRILIKAKAAQNLSNGTYASICNALCITFNCDKSAIKFEDGDAPCSVKATVFPIVEINEAGFTATQAMAIIQSLLPICVTLEPIVVDGTFVFTDTEGVIDTAKGFGGYEGDTVGGVFGAIYGASEEEALML